MYQFTTRGNTHSQYSFSNTIVRWKGPCWHTWQTTLLRELIVKLRMRRSTARVDSALEVTTMPNNRPGARSLDADANEARTSPKPNFSKRKLCSSYASAKGCAQGETCP
eukprot:4601283-Amphidinium_carterae.1